MNQSIVLHSTFFVLSLALAGCFNEPEPAYKSVPAENRVYLSDKGLKALPQVNAVLGRHRLVRRLRLVEAACESQA